MLLHDESGKLWRFNTVPLKLIDFVGVSLYVRMIAICEHYSIMKLFRLLCMDKNNKRNTIRA